MIERTAFAFKNDRIFESHAQGIHVGGLHADIMLKALRHEHVFFFEDNDSQRLIFHKSSTFYEVARNVVV